MCIRKKQTPPSNETVALIAAALFWNFSRLAPFFAHKPARQRRAPSFFLADVAR